MIRTFKFKLTGFMPLLMHADSIDESDMVSKWRKDPSNKGVSVAGDDRSPAWTWQTYLYHDGNHVAMPSDNIMVALRDAGKQMILKKQKTFKEITQSGLLITSDYCQFKSNGKQIGIESVRNLREKQFEEQCDHAKQIGFSLFSKRVRIGTAKHIRVRPRFDNWEVSGEILAKKDEITKDILSQLFTLAGGQGLCDWRPGCKTPGPYGQFTAEVAEV